MRPSRSPPAQTARSQPPAPPPGANGAHFLIDKDGTIYQTASLNKTCDHVGKLKSRCAYEQTCSPGETKLNQKFNAKAENEREIVKQAGVRYPSNKDSIGIELVGDSFPKGTNIDQKKVKFEIVTDAQNESLRWLVEQLKKEYRIPDSEVFGHPEISYKISLKPAQQNGKNPCARHHPQHAGSKLSCRQCMSCKLHSCG